MPLIKDNTEKVFDDTSIQKGDLIRAKYKSWLDARNGLVTAVSENKLTVLFISGPGAATNFFVILASEVVEGKWNVSWTSDLTTINVEGAGV